MKKTLLLILAMCFAFAMPAQAAEEWDDRSLTSTHAAAGDVIGPKVTDNATLPERSVRRQLEAADFYLSKVTSAEKITDENTGNHAFAGTNLPYEVGWRIENQKEA